MQCSVYKKSVSVYSFDGHVWSQLLQQRHTFVVPLLLSPPSNRFNNHKNVEYLNRQGCLFCLIDDNLLYDAHYFFWLNFYFLAIKKGMCYVLFVASSFFFSRYLLPVHIKNIKKNKDQKHTNNNKAKLSQTVADVSYVFLSCC